MPPRKQVLVEKNSTSAHVNKKQPQRSEYHNKIIGIFKAAQTSNSFHLKYQKELKSIYELDDHGKFTDAVCVALRTWLQQDADNEYADNGLRFLADFVMSYCTEDDDGEAQDAIFKDTFDYVVGLDSKLKHIRCRICHFLNLLLNGPTMVDDILCDKLEKRMLDLIETDNVALVRAEAACAMYRLQDPQNPECPIIKTYLVHLSTDPSARVRRTILSKLVKNKFTIPHLIERLSDIDGDVRRMSILQLTGVPVNFLKISQRLKILSLALRDSDSKVKEATNKKLLPSWLKMYDGNHLALLEALKYDASMEDFQRLEELAKEILETLFQNTQFDILLAQLPLQGSEGERLIPVEKLTVENAIYWRSLIDYVKNTEALEQRHTDVISDLGTFCDYIKKFINEPVEYPQDDDEHAIALVERKSNQILLTLLNISGTFELADEVGRQHLKELLLWMLDVVSLDEEPIRRIIKQMENVIPDAKERMESISAIVNNARSIETNDTKLMEIVGRIKNQENNFEIMQAKMEIYGMQEEEQNLMDNRDFDKAARINADISKAVIEFVAMIKAAISKETMGSDENNSSDETDDMKYLTDLENVADLRPKVLINNLRMMFLTICSKKGKKLEPCILDIYEKTIVLQCFSSDKQIRDWSLKCSTTIALLYKKYAERVFENLFRQFIVHKEPTIWATSILAICELFSRYGITHFEECPIDDDINDDDNETEDPVQSRIISKSPTMKFLTHIYESCENKCIRKALVQGFCILILSGQYTNDMVSKMLLEYFRAIDEDEQGNSNKIDLEVNQILGVFFQTLVKRKLQSCLSNALFDAVNKMLESVDGRYNFMPETIIKFVVVTTAPSDPNNALNVHNKLAELFVDVMLERSGEKEFVKLLARELVSLKINSDVMKPKIKSKLEELLERKCVTDKKTMQSLKSLMADQDTTQEAHTTTGISISGLSTIPPSEDDNRTENGSQFDEDNYDCGDLPTDGNDSPEDDFQVPGTSAFTPFRRSLTNAHQSGIGDENTNGENEQSSTSGETTPIGRARRTRTATKTGSIRKRLPEKPPQSAIAKRQCR